MAGARRRKCKSCHKLFRPDPRNRYHQRYCAAPSCRAASKAASQARWLAAPENRDYFRGPVNVARVRAWRSRNPGYSTNKKANFASPTLQEFLSAQPAVLIGLIAHITGTPHQEDIARTTDRLLRLGQDILATSAARDGP
jgi:hypothetical protein